MNKIEPVRICITPLLFLLEGKKDLVIAELGVFNGLSTKTILEKYDVKKYYAIDLWEMYDGYVDLAWNFHKWFREELDDYVYKEFLERTKDFPQIEIIREYTNLAHKHIKDGELDFCFVDANHDYEYVYEDIKLWLPKIKKGGIICGDDYTHMTPGVKKAVDDFFKNTDYEVHIQYDISWWVRV